MTVQSTPMFRSQKMNWIGGCLLIVVLLFVNASALHAQVADTIWYHPDRVVGPWPEDFQYFDLDSAIAEYEKSLIKKQEPDTVRFSLLFAGDIMGHDTQIESAWDEVSQSYLYDHTFDYVSTYVSEADLAIANLEVTLAGPPYKGYPQFSSPDELAVSAQKAGFDFFGTANNHACDLGKKGVERTIQILDSLQIGHTGTFVNQAAKDSLYPAVLQHNGVRLALLNYTYGTNGIDPTPPNVVNYIDTAVMGSDLRRTRALNTDLTLVFMHWGKEYVHTPNSAQKRAARYCRSMGADIIIGAHPHVLQPFEWESGMPMVWSLGNYVSNQRAYPKDGGAMFRMTVAKTSDSIWVEQADYILTWVYRPEIAGKDRFYILPIVDFEGNAAFFKSAEDYDKMMRFAEGMRELFGTGPDQIVEFNPWVKQEED